MGFSIPPYACYFHNTNMAGKSEEKWMVSGMPELRSRLRRYAWASHMGWCAWGTSVDAGSPGRDIC